jgi:transposase
MTAEGRRPSLSDRFDRSHAARLQSATLERLYRTAYGDDYPTEAHPNACPRDWGYRMSVWTTTWVRHFSSRRFGMVSCRERVRQLRHALGFRWRRLRHRHLKAKPEEPAVFVAALAELLAKWPEDWELVLVDEATVRRHPTLTLQLWKLQPAYSPELNPQERMWKGLRRVVTHHHGFASLREPSEAIRNVFRSLAGVKDQVQRLSLQRHLPISG